MNIEGTVDYFFTDDHTDPLNIREWTSGTSDPKAVWEWWRYITDGGGKVYKITGEWHTKFYAEAKLKESESRYQWPDNK